MKDSLAISGSVNKTLLAMSGGVDSSVAACLLKREGKNVVGALMKLFESDSQSAKSCCSVTDAEDARTVAAALDIPFYVFNFKDEFEQEVIGRFVNTYRQGATPNPCIDCNRYMKFRKFLHRADELGCEFIATGHYARISAEPGGRFLLKTGLDPAKDQSYVLYSMTQPQLSRTLFPLGGLTKAEVRGLAGELGLVNAKKRESQDICFAPDGDYAGLIAKRAQIKKGRFVNSKGETLGEHRGLVYYTIGQRKGLGLYNPTPLYVLRLNAADNTVTLGVADELLSKTLTARDINFIPFEKLDGPLRVQAKIRYAHSPAPATLWQTDADEVKVEFDLPQRAITPGQAIVWYDKDIVIGGGTIIKGGG